MGQASGDSRPVSLPRVAGPLQGFIDSGTRPKLFRANWFPRSEGFCVTSSSAHRPGAAPCETSSGSVEPAGPPSDAVTLGDLIADAGPLPADAALECVQRLAELLDEAPNVNCAVLGPGDVLIDDDGGVWLTRRFADDPSGKIAASQPARMDRLGRLLAFLATGENGHLSEGFTVETTSLPSPIATIAAKLFARNGMCYQSYAELARDAADLREPTPSEPALLPVEALPVEPAANVEPSEDIASELATVEPKAKETLTADAPLMAETEPEAVIEDSLPLPEEPVPSSHVEPVPTTAEPTAAAVAPTQEPASTEDSPPMTTAPEAASESSWLGIGVAAAVAVGAAVAYVIWNLL